MNIETIVVGDFQANCHVIWESESAALVVDPGADAEAVMRVIKGKGLRVARYLLTHGHVDHISAVAEMCRALPAPISIHKDDLEWAFGSENTFEPFYGRPDRPPVEPDCVEDGDDLCEGGMTCRTIHTPGHSPGSVCFHFPEAGLLVTGDTLFAGSVGRTDLPGGDTRQLQASIGKIAGLPDATLVYPGHGPATDIGREKRTNFFLQARKWT